VTKQEALEVLGTATRRPQTLQFQSLRALFSARKTLYVVRKQYTFGVKIHTDFEHLTLTLVPAEEPVKTQPHKPESVTTTDVTPSEDLLDLVESEIDVNKLNF